MTEESEKLHILPVVIRTVKTIIDFLNQRDLELIIFSRFQTFLCGSNLQPFIHTSAYF